MVPREALDILETRALVWQTVFALLKLGHKERLPGRPFGPDLPLFLVYGTALLSVYGRRPVRASSISRQLEIPRETVRRHLAQLVKLGILERRDGTYDIGESARHVPHAKAFVRTIHQAAARLM